MKFAYQDILNFLVERPSKKLLSEKLFQLGHEHEIDGDIFDMELTPNRGDCLSLLGLSRDLNIFFGNRNDLSIYEGDFISLDINFENCSPNDCPKISFLEIEIENNYFKYQTYLEDYIINIGNKKTNFFSDISNYISYELGQPTHCYDREALNTKLFFENKESNEIFKTLLNDEVELNGKNCIFRSEDQIISLAGIIGGATTACSTETKKVLVECAYFNPESIIGKSIKYNQYTDAAYKFERGVDINIQEYVLRRFLRIVEDHVKVKSVKYKTFTSIAHKDVFISDDVNKINRILGIQITKSEYHNYLKKLGFKITDKIKIPSFRSDVKTQNDLAEEIARVIGYNNIKSEPINFKKSVSETQINKIQIIQSLLVKNGFTEVINFPFTPSKEKNSIHIDNPLDSTRGNLRTCLKASLIENLLYNERRQKDSIKLFEISDIYTKETKINQQKKIGIIISGRLGNNYLDFSKKLSREYLENTLNNLLFNKFTNIEEIDRNSLNTKKKDKIFYIELEIEKIPNSFFTTHQFNKIPIKFFNYKQVSEFPSSTRDLSFSISDLSKTDEVLNYLDNITDDILKDSYTFDFYKDHKNNILKIGRRFIFQSHSRTLSDEEINSKIFEILQPLIKINGVFVPGM